MNAAAFYSGIYLHFKFQHLCHAAAVVNNITVFCNSVNQTIE